MHHVGWESRTDVVLLFYFKRVFFLHFSSFPLRAYSLRHCSGVFSCTFRPPFAPHSTPFCFLLFAFSRASIWTVLFSISSSFVLRLVWSCALILSLPFSFAFTFDFKFVRASFGLKLCAHSFSSIFFYFYWYCYCIEHLFVLCGFGRVRLADLGLFVLLVLASPLRVRFWHYHYATRGVFLSSLKWKNNIC